MHSGHCFDFTVELRRIAVIKTTFTAKEAWTDAVGRPETQYDARMQSLMGLALAQIDILYKPKLIRVNGTRTRRYYRIGTNSGDEWMPLPEGHETPK
ncbi:hypothetical protein [Octadecabacter antarcticus]|nr:hypothetical protein [Octadecabacter antarcticus]